MTKEKYMALADVQTLWTEKIKPTLYSKTDVNTKFDQFAGPTYDQENRCVVFPSNSKVSYDAAHRCVVFG